MATMIPDLNPGSISNNGERRVYQSLSALPDAFTVCYSYKYRDDYDDSDIIREADFVLVHPSMGYLVLEVKQGVIMHQNGTWYEFKDNGYQPLHKDPLEQARSAMFAILHQFQKITSTPRFPLHIRHALCFPESQRVDGILPQVLDADSLWLFDDIETPGRLQSRIERLFHPLPEPNKAAVDVLIKKILNPTFKIFSRLEEQITRFEAESQTILNEEQERVLEETELDRRKIFLGAAGTGKTFLAMEKARRVAAQAQTVLLTCFNKSLAGYIRQQLPESIQVQTIHDYFMNAALEADPQLGVPESMSERSEFFSKQLPILAYDVLAEKQEEDRFDCIIIDEGQDFQPDWMACIEEMLKKDGQIYIFADPAQSLFRSDLEHIQGFPVSKQRLTRNMRNTQMINQWMLHYLPGVNLKCLNIKGMPVNFLPCAAADQYRIMEKEIGRLVSQGIPIKRIMVLSPHVYEKSCLAGRTHIKEWPVLDNRLGSGHAIRFSTIRSFKGLEADIVFLVDIRPSHACTEADIYVGGSRARYLLYILHEEGMPVGSSEGA